MQFHTCCFTGHRELSPTCERALTEILDRRLEALFAIGFTEFRTGGALGFDTLAARRVLALRKRHPTCRLVLMLPCPQQAQGWRAAERLEWERIKAAADAVHFARERYTPDCMHARNRALVDGSDLCLSYLTENRGGTLYTCAYALKQGVRLINLADELSQTEKE